MDPKPEPDEWRLFLYINNKIKYEYREVILSQFTIMNPANIKYDIDFR